MGFSDPPTCIDAICSTPGTYSSIGSCESCPKNCATCSNPDKCGSCKPGNFLQVEECISCPSKCKTCTSLSNCQSCNSGYGLLGTICVLCPAGYTLVNGICQTSTLSETVKEILEKTQLVSSAAASAANVASKGSAVGLSAMVGGRIFSLIKYLNIRYSNELQVALETWLPSFISLGLTPDLPNSITEDFKSQQSKAVPIVFAKYDIVSSFVVNFWENLGIIILASGLWVVFKAIEFGFRENKESKAYAFIRTCQEYVQNFLLSVLYGVYGDLVFFAIIEYRTYDSEVSIALISVILSIILLVVMTLHIAFHIRLLIQYQTIKKSLPKNPPDSPYNLKLEEFTKKTPEEQGFI